MVKEITGQALEALVEKGGKVVCDFWASWCAPCRMLAPVLEKLANEFEGRAEFVKVDVDANGDLAASLGIMGIPAVFVFENGQVKAQNIGFYPEEQLRAFFSSNI